MSVEQQPVFRIAGAQYETRGGFGDVVVTISLVAAIVASALMGVVVPYVFRLVRVDPAIAAGPLVTTLDDIIAIGIYYLVALALIAR